MALCYLGCEFQLELRMIAAAFPTVTKINFTAAFNPIGLGCLSHAQCSVERESCGKPKKAHKEQVANVSPRIDHEWQKA